MINRNNHKSQPVAVELKSFRQLLVLPHTAGKKDIAFMTVLKVMASSSRGILRTGTKYSISKA